MRLMLRSVTMVSPIFVACLLAACATSPAGKGALQGTWTVTTGEHEGKPLDIVVGGVLTVSGDGFHIHTASGAELEGHLQIAADKHPAELDFVHATGMHWLAIYEVKDQTLRLNYVDASGTEARPTQFVTSSATEASLLTLRRTSPVN